VILLVLLAVAAAAGAVAWWWVSTRPGPVTVASVVDARTVEVAQDGANRVLTLEGLVAPTGSQCLAEEASALLASLLPGGTEVTLDPADDVATAATIHAGALVVDAEMAKAGFAVAVPGQGDRSDEVRAAQLEARNGQVGIYDPGVACSPVAEVIAYQSAVSSTTSSRPTATDTTWADGAAKLVADGELLDAELGSSRTEWPWAAFTDDDVAALREAVAAARQAVTDAREMYLVEEEARQEAARQAAEEAARREAARLAEEEAARRAEAERQTAEAERARQAEADRAAAAAQPGYRWSNAVAEEVATQFGLTVRYVSTTACGSTGHIDDTSYAVAGCYTTGTDYFELTTTALMERAADETVRFVAYHEAMHWLTWKTCGAPQFDRVENVTDAMTYLHGGLTASGGGYGYTDADLAVAQGILAGTCPS